MRYLCRSDLSLHAWQVNDGAWRSIQGVDLYPHSGGFIDSVWDLHGIIGYTYEGSSILGGKPIHRLPTLHSCPIQSVLQYCNIACRLRFFYG
jgi:hypothetical protein